MRARRARGPAPGTLCPAAVPFQACSRLDQQVSADASRYTSTSPKTGQVMSGCGSGVCARLRWPRLLVVLQGTASSSTPAASNAACRTSLSALDASASWLRSFTSARQVHRWRVLHVCMHPPFALRNGAIGQAHRQRNHSLLLLPAARCMRNSNRARGGLTCGPCPPDARPRDCDRRVVHLRRRASPGSAAAGRPSDPELPDRQPPGAVWQRGAQREQMPPSGQNRTAYTAKAKGGGASGSVGREAGSGGKGEGLWMLRC